MSIENLINIFKKKDFEIKNFNSEEEFNNFIKKYKCHNIFFSKSYICDIEQKLDEDLAENISYTFCIRRDRIYKEYPQLKNKKIIIVNLQANCHQEKVYEFSIIWTISCNIVIKGN